MKPSFTSLSTSRVFSAHQQTTLIAAARVTILAETIVDEDAITKVCSLVRCEGSVLRRVVCCDSHRVTFFKNEVEESIYCDKSLPKWETLTPNEPLSNQRVEKYRYVYYRFHLTNPCIGFKVKVSLRTVVRVNV